MALITRKQFIEDYGVKQAHITMGLKRGNLVLDASGQIDTKNEVNALYIQRLAAKRAGKLPPQDPEDEKKDKPGTDLTALTAIRTKAQIKKTIEETEIARLKKEKLMGMHIPIDMVEALIVNATESVKVAYLDAGEDLIIRISAEHRLSRDKQGQHKKQLIESVNRAVNAAADMAIKNLKRIQREYSDARGRGEHD